MPASERRPLWNYVRGLAPPVLVLSVLVGWLALSWYEQVRLWREADEYNLREWLNEARPFRKTLPDLVKEYLELRQPTGSVAEEQEQARTRALATKTEEIREHLKALGTPLRMYPGQLPLFPDIYRIELRFQEGLEPPEPLVWDSNLPRPSSLGRPPPIPLLGDGDKRVVAVLDYQLHAFNKQQQDERQMQTLTLGVSALVGVAVILAALWVYFFLRRERRREMQTIRAEQQVEHAERMVLENELRRQEAESRQRETERKLLEQRLEAARQESRAVAAEKQALELKSQFYASIGIMAGSYAHNIKNLLVRPNDLLRRCLEADGLSPNQDQMLNEVRDTLGTVTERLQQILRTVRRDPSRAELCRIDLNVLATDIQRTWSDLALEKWKLGVQVELSPEPLEIEGDASHLQQAIENLLFNARDATFEMRNHLRDRARARNDDVRQAVIAAAGWRGTVILRTRRDGDQAILEVQDNGIGMSEDVRRRCTETHFSTKRDNALYEGYNAGMGLGLAFVEVILQHHLADMEIDSEPLQGACFRIRFPMSHGAATGDNVSEAANSAGTARS